MFFTLAPLLQSLCQVFKTGEMKWQLSILAKSVAPFVVKIIAEYTQEIACQLTINGFKRETSNSIQSPN